MLLHGRIMTVPDSSRLVSPAEYTLRVFLDDEIIAVSYDGLIGPQDTE